MKPVYHLRFREICFWCINPLIEGYIKQRLLVALLFLFLNLCPSILVI